MKSGGLGWEFKHGWDFVVCGGELIRHAEIGIRYWTELEEEGLRGCGVGSCETSHFDVTD